MNREQILALVVVMIVVNSASAFLHHGFVRSTFITNNPSTRLFSSTNDERPRDSCEDFYDDKFNAEELKQFTDREKIKETEIFELEEDLEIPEDVHIILFNPNTDNEGVHTLEYPKGSGNNIVLAFESQKECEKFSDTLWGQDFYEPQPQKIPFDALTSYCEEIGVSVQLVPRGTPIVPPEDNTDELGLNPNLEFEKEFIEQLYDKSIGLDENCDDAWA